MNDVISAVEQIARAYRSMSFDERESLTEGFPSIVNALEDLMKIPYWQIDPTQSRPTPGRRLRRIPADGPARMAKAIEEARVAAPMEPGDRFGWPELHAVIDLIDSWSVIEPVAEPEPEPEADLDDETNDERPGPYILPPVTPFPQRGTAASPFDIPDTVVSVSTVRQYLERSGVPAPAEVDDPFVPGGESVESLCMWLMEVVTILRGYRRAHEDALREKGTR